MVRIPSYELEITNFFVGKVKIKKLNTVSKTTNGKAAPGYQGTKAENRNSS
jgi:hypothetical protein